MWADPPYMALEALLPVNKYWLSTGELQIHNAYPSCWNKQLFCYESRAVSSGDLCCFLCLVALKRQSSSHLQACIDKNSVAGSHSHVSAAHTCAGHITCAKDAGLTAGHLPPGPASSSASRLGLRTVALMNKLMCGSG